MVETGRPSIWAIDFDSRRHPHLPVEVIDRTELTRRVNPVRLASPQRPSFWMFLLLRSARGSHTVDFTTIPARSGRLVQIRPGQTQCFSTDDPIDAALVLSQPGTASARPWFPGHRTYCDLSGTSEVTAGWIVDALRHEQEHFEDDDPTRRLMVALFAALVALFDQSVTESGDDDLPAPYVAFRDAVEIDLTHRHSVGDYARAIGYSARTVSRACRRVTGQTAKRVLDDRLVLEAKRLLVHTDMTAATIGAHLGFSEPTNFTKFFTRYTTVTPGAFRQQHQQLGEASR